MHPSQAKIVRLSIHRFSHDTMPFMNIFKKQGLFVIARRFPLIFLSRLVQPIITLVAVRASSVVQ